VDSSTNNRNPVYDVSAVSLLYYTDTLSCVLLRVLLGAIVSVECVVCVAYDICVCVVSVLCVFVYQSVYLVEHVQEGHGSLLVILSGTSKEGQR
jgi:hypothetical protein